jgi:hypothetical protein
LSYSFLLFYPPFSIPHLTQFCLLRFIQSHLTFALAIY